MKRAITFVIYGGCILVLIWMLVPFSRPGAGGDKKTVDTAPAEFRAIEQVVDCTGEVSAAQATDIKSEISGRIAKVDVKPGNHVKAGDIVVELDDLELKSEEHEAVLRIEASRLRQAKANMDYQRKAELETKKFVMRKEVEDAKTELDLAGNAMEIDGAHLQTIRERLVKSVIRSPHAGVVLNLKAREGVVVTGANTSGEATLLMQIANVNELQIQSEINEVDMIKVTPGMAASVTFDAVPGVKIDGTVSYVSPSALPKEKDKSVRVFAMTVQLRSTAADVKPGISANVRIATASNPRALTVSLGAVFNENSEPCVFVKSGSGFERRKVELGINDNGFVEIKQGLKQGEEVALQHPPV